MTPSRGLDTPEEERVMRRAALRAQAIEMMSDLRRYRQERAVARNRPMPAEEFQLLQEQIGLIGRMTLTLDLERFLWQCDRAEALGPILDPTLFKQYLSDPMARANMETMVEYARGLLKIRAAAEKLVETMAAAE